LEDLFSVLIVIIGIVASIVSSARKNRNSKAAMQQYQSEASARRAEQPQTQPAEKKEPHPYAPVQTMMPAVSAANVPGQVIAPTVHAHVQRDCDTHDAPGSLGVTSMEGKDPCHEDELTLERTFAEPAPAEGGLTFNWTGSSMVNAVVMQEVLTRPSQRRAR